MSPRRLTYLILVMAAALTACGKISPEVSEEGDDPITFYIKAHETKTIIEDNSSLLGLAPSIYVNDLSGNNPAFTGNEVKHAGNGIWRSNVNWVNGKDYVLYAYVSSVGKSSNVTPSNQGRSVSITQPTEYSSSTDAYSDYLLSWSVSANGSTKGLVQLNLERVTTGVELYMSKSPGMSSVRLESASFRNILNSSSFTITNMAASTDQPRQDGMKHTWRQETGSSQVTYTYPQNGNEIELETYNPEDGPFSYGKEYRVMNFLTVQQPTSEELSTGERNIVLDLEYSVWETDKYVSYSASFTLSDYTPSIWTRGHKVRYYITIDSGIKLAGEVARWEEVDYIEGTLLPK